MSLASAQAAHKAKPKVRKTPKAPLQAPEPQPGEQRQRGRPSAYSIEIADRLCERIAMREPLSKITCDDDMPCETTIYKWRMQYPEFAEKVARAREHRALARADYMDEVVDDVRFGRLDPQSGRVVLESERWQAGKEMPKVFGDKVDVTSAGQQIQQVSLSDLELARRAMHWMGSLRALDVVDVEALPAPKPTEPAKREGERS